MLDNSLLLSSTFLNSGVHDIWRYSVINMSNHEETHTIGFMMNQQVLNFKMDIIPSMYEITAPMPKKPCPIYCGGPVSTDKITIIHSPEYYNSKTSKVNQFSSVTFNNQIFQDIHDGNGPKEWKIMLGFCAWLPGQLEAELKRGNSWMMADCDEYMWGRYKKKSKMWTRIVEKNGAEQANQFLESILH